MKLVCLQSRACLLLPFPMPSTIPCCAVQSKRSLQARQKQAAWRHCSPALCPCIAPKPCAPALLPSLVRLHCSPALCPCICHCRDVATHTVPSFLVPNSICPHSNAIRRWNDGCQLPKMAMRYMLSCAQLRKCTQPCDGSSSLRHHSGAAPVQVCCPGTTRPSRALPTPCSPSYGR